MVVLETIGWDEYALLDSGNGLRLEQYGKYVLQRPDPQTIWQPHLSKEIWQEADAAFYNDTWQKKEAMPKRWLMHFEDISFYASLTPFKHTGVFPEQSLQWQWMRDKIADAKREITVLNLFGYTGIASLVLAKKGAKVTHVDASKPTLAWARENQAVSGLSDEPIRWILDDAIKFTAREIRRGVHYDAILMDPPSFGHGTSKTRWEFHKDFPLLLSQCQKLLSQNPLFFLINAYAISSSAIMLENMLRDFSVFAKGTITAGELALSEKKTKRLLSTGIFARWAAF